MQLCLSKVSTILPHSPIWFVIYPHWFVNAAFCTSKHPTTVKNARQIITFLPKLLHNSNKSRTFASTELVCIPSELQASHFFIINYESESKNNSAADSHTQIKRDGFQRRKPRHVISDKNQLFPSKVLLDGYVSWKCRVGHENRMWTKLRSFCPKLVDFNTAIICHLNTAIRWD